MYSNRGPSLDAGFGIVYPTFQFSQASYGPAPTSSPERHADAVLPGNAQLQTRKTDNQQHASLEFPHVGGGGFGITGRFFPAFLLSSFVRFFFGALGNEHVSICHLTSSPSTTRLLSLRLSRSISSTSNSEQSCGAHSHITHETSYPNSGRHKNKKRTYPFPLCFTIAI